MDTKKYEFSRPHTCGNLNFTVTGGPFASPQTMGWHITDSKGFTVGVCCSSEFVKYVQQLEDEVEKWKRKYQNLVGEGNVPLPNLLGGNLLGGGDGSS